MLFLAIDTATKTAGVALLKDGRPLGEMVLNVGLTHSVSLLPAIHRLCMTSGVTVDDVDALAFASGPGSFTGLRIGGAFITGLAQVKNLPIYAIPTLDALAQNGEGFNGYIAPILDARKNEYYTATYRYQNGYIIKVEEEKAQSPEDFCNKFDNPCGVMVVGDAVFNSRQLLEDRGFKIPSELLLTTRAVNIAYLAFQKYKKQEKALTYQEVRPFYLRASEAEVKLLQKLGEKNA